jgi:hypothetical protein
MGNSPISPAGSGTSYDPPRRVPRYTYAAVAEITDTTSQTRLELRIAELSRRGCFVDTMNPLPLGTPLKVVISQDQGTFATDGKVIYVQESIGMGVAFLESSPEKLKILDAWLSSRSPADAL